FTVAGVNVANGVLTDLTTSDSGITWTATLTPDSNVTDTTNMLTLDLTGINDLAGNSGVGSSTSGNYSIDTTRPALASAITVSDTALQIGDTATVTFSFTEAVSGFTTADVAMANGVLTDLTTSDSGITWTATLTPDSNVTDTSNTLTLDLTGINDLAGNSGVGSISSGNYTIDTARPTASIAVTDSALTLGDTSLVTITFSEAVNGFTNADLTVDNGSLSNVSSNDGGITWTAILTPTLSVIDNSNVIRLSNNNVQDSAGNTGSGSTVSNNYTINTDTAPSASPLNQNLDYIEDTTTAISDIVITDPDADSFTATVTMADGNSSNGSLSASSGHGEIYNVMTGVWSVTGSLTDVNAALAALSFVSAPNKHSATSATVLISDGVNAPLTGTLQFNGIAVNDAPFGIPSLIGTLEQGQIITADISAITDADGISGAYSYVWKADGKTINNANAATYQLTQAEVGKTITVHVSYTDNDTTLETVTSLASAQVANINDAPAASDDTAIAVEIGGIDSIPGINPSGNVLTNDSDMDAGDTFSVTAIANGVVGGSIEGKYGRLHLNSDGSYTYIVNNNNPLVDALNNGESLVDSFNYTLTDAAGLSDNAYLKITIQGQTDAAIDQDGISAVIENAGGDGDANNDGIPDAEQSNVTNLPLISAEDFALGSQAPATSYGALIVGDLSSEDGEVSLNANTEIDNVKVLSTAEAETLYGAVVAAELAQISQDSLFTGLLNYTIKATGNNGLTDLDPTRAGVQTRLVIALPEA
ncbi:Ig-like domain-containing protein, partial [Methylocucumis oryzae]|uniref:Ig-like domain-containing protein n=1 Tax=Methylocucumis oryzae TaxID=1632867 RepID=UPI000A618193